MNNNMNANSSNRQKSGKAHVKLIPLLALVGGLLIPLVARAQEAPPECRDCIFNCNQQLANCSTQECFDNIHTCFESCPC